MIILELKAKFVSSWEEGDVYSSCLIDTETFDVFDIETANEGEEYEHLIDEYVEVKLNSEVYKFKYDTEKEKICESERKRFSDLLKEKNIPLNDEEKNELFIFCKIYIEDFGAMPLEFEINQKLYNFDEISEALTGEQHTELSSMI